MTTYHYINDNGDIERLTKQINAEKAKDVIVVIEPRRSLTKSDFFKKVSKGDKVICSDMETLSDGGLANLLDVLDAVLRKEIVLYFTEANLTIPDASNHGIICLVGVLRLLRSIAGNKLSKEKYALVKDRRKNGSTGKYGRNGKLLTYKEIAEILQLAESRELPYREIGERYGVTRATIYNIRMRYARGTAEHEEMLETLKESK